MVQKVVINTCHGEFGVKDEVMKLYMPDEVWDIRINRTDPRLIKAIEELGADAVSDEYAVLKILEIPDGVEWDIEEYDGAEWIAEKHRKWT